MFFGQLTVRAIQKSQAVCLVGLIPKAESIMLRGFHFSMNGAWLLKANFKCQPHIGERLMLCEINSAEPLHPVRLGVV